MKAIEKITKLASELDERGMDRAASVLDKISSRVLKIVEAQYVGVQGWAIRNSRCWQNCYRQKRASSPDRATQEIWSDCHAEYIKYVNEADDKWAKYAEESEGIKKFASARPNIYRQVMAWERDFFHKEAARKMQFGMRPEDAVIQTFKDSVQKYKVALYQEADKLLKLAERTKSKDKVLSQKLAECAKEVVRFAYASSKQEK